MERKRGRLFLLIVYVLLPMLLMLALYLGWRLSLENATVVLKSAVSPDGVYRADVVRRDPGASSHYEFMVRISPAKLTPLARMLLAVPFSPRYVALDLHHEPDKLNVDWTGSEEVTIRCEGCSGVPAGDPVWRTVRLKYQLE